MLGCSTKAVYRMASERRLTHHKVGRLVRFTKSDLEEFLARNRREAE